MSTVLVCARRSKLRLAQAPGTQFHIEANQSNPGAVDSTLHRAA